MTQKKAFIYTTIVFALITLFSYLANAQPTGKIVGVWQRDDNNLIIEIYKAGPQYFGKQIWGNSLFENDGITPKKDENNSNERLRRTGTQKPHRTDKLRLRGSCIRWWNLLRL